MGFFDFIKKLFSDTDEPDIYDLIEVSDGRASCKICDKELDGNVYTVKGNKSYYCKKHAKELAYKILQGEVDYEDKESKSYRKHKTITEKEHKPYVRPYPGHCEAPGCNHTPSGLDVYHCKYCDNYHCPKHRIAEDHQCTGNLKSLKKEGMISYSSRR